MAELTGISWSDSTFNPWLGCTKVSPACDHCYAERLMDHRMHKVQWGAGQARRRTSAANWRQPLAWNSRAFSECMSCGWRGEARVCELSTAPPPGFDSDPGPIRLCHYCKRPTLKEARRRVFCASLADVFDNEVDPAWRSDLFNLIADTPHLDWLLLTKRVGNVRAMLDAYIASDGHIGETWDTPWPNVWLGATICNQEEADRDIPKLLAVPAAVRFLSIEPMLGPVRLGRPEARAWAGRVPGVAGIDWIICGGESGPQARPLHPDWVRSLRDQCAAAGVPFHFKQWGEWAPGNGGPGGDLYPRDRTKLESGMFTYSGAWTPGGPNPFRQTMDRVGTKAAGRLLDGMEHNGFPS